MVLRPVRRKETSDLRPAPLEANAPVPSRPVEDEVQVDRLVAESRRRPPREISLLQAATVEIKGTVLNPINLPSLKGDESSVRANQQEEMEEVMEKVELNLPDHESQMEVEVPAALRIPLVRDGVGATLALLSLTGNPFEVGGSGSKRAHSPKQKQFGDIELIYRDESGQQLDPKAAYKQLSRRFHGKDKGFGRQEKELRRKQAAQRSHASQLAQRAKEMQAALGTPHLVLDAAFKEAEPRLNETQDSLPPAKKKKQTRIFGLHL